MLDLTCGNLYEFSKIVQFNASKMFYIFNFSPTPDLNVPLIDPFAAYRAFLPPEYQFADRPSFQGRPGYSGR
jgi:hypothetical protein